MRNALFLAVILLASPFARAQQAAPASPEPETLFGRILKRSSGYGAAVTRFSSFHGELAVLAGGYGGWFINDRFLVGGGAYGLASGISAPDADNRYPGKRSTWAMGYGGLVLEYTLHSKKLVHPSFNTLVGAGGVGKYVHGINNNNQDWQDYGYDNSGFFVVEPGANVEVNLTRWFRFGAGASYRFIRGSNTSGITDAQLSAPAGNVSLKFGGF
ncbi:MAG: hypothetical protein H7Z75_07795 [Ferruginibacter sp.]|nr:hypothetical protein [Cytophagales bacterium]